MSHGVVACGQVYFVLQMALYHSYEETAAPATGVSSFVDAADFYSYTNPSFCADATDLD